MSYRAPSTKEPFELQNLECEMQCGEALENHRILDNSQYSVKRAKKPKQSQPEFQNARAELRHQPEAPAIVSRVGARACLNQLESPGWMKRPAQGSRHEVGRKSCRARWPRRVAGTPRSLPSKIVSSIIR